METGWGVIRFRIGKTGGAVVRTIMNFRVPKNARRDSSTGTRVGNFLRRTVVGGTSLTERIYFVNNRY